MSEFDFEEEGGSSTTSEIDFEEQEGPRYVTLEDAKGIKQYERLKTAFMEDNNVLVHFGAYGLIFGIPQSGALTFANLIQYLNLCFKFFELSDSHLAGIRRFEGQIGLVSIKFRQAYKRADTVKIKTSKIDGKKLVPPGSWNIVQDNGDLIPLHTVRFMERFLIGDESHCRLPMTLQPKDDKPLVAESNPRETDVVNGSKNRSELEVVLLQGVELVKSTTVEEADGGESEKNETGFSFRPSRDSGIFNAYRAKNGDYRGQGPRYKDPNLEYTHLWDAEAKCYVNNLVVDGNYLDLLPEQDLRRRVCLFSGKSLRPDDPTSGDYSLFPIFPTASIDLWNREHNDRIKPLLRESFPENESYPPRLSAVHSPLNMVSAMGATGLAFCFNAISVNPTDKYKIVSLIPLQEGAKFFDEEDIQPSLTLKGIEVRDRPDKRLLLDHLQYSLLLRCAWFYADELYRPSSDMHIPEALRRSIYEEGESPSDKLTMDLHLPDGHDPCDKDFRTMLME